MWSHSTLHIQSHKEDFSEEGKTYSTTKHRVSNHTIKTGNNHRTQIIYEEQP